MHLAIKKNNHKTNQTTTQQKENKTQTTTPTYPTKNPLYSPSKHRKPSIQRQFDKHKNTYIKVTIQIQKKNIKNIKKNYVPYVSYVSPYIIQTEAKPSSHTPNPPYHNQTSESTNDP